MSSLVASGYKPRGRLYCNQFMVKKISHQGITWIDVTSPTKDEVQDLAKEHDLHPLLQNELLSPSLRSKVDVYEEYLFLVLHFPRCAICQGEPAEILGDSQEVDFIIGKNVLITTHYEQIAQLDELAEIMEVNPASYRSSGKTHAGHILFAIIRRLYQNQDDALLLLNQKLKEAEGRIFAGEEKTMVKELSNLNRELLDFHWALKNHSDVLASFEVAGREFFGDTFRYYLRAIIGEYEKIWNALQSNRETGNELRQTNESLLAIKTNEVMKILTIMAFITFPLTVFTSLFGMNTVNNPILGRPNDFWDIVVIMLAAVSLMFIFFRYKKWL